MKSITNNPDVILIVDDDPLTLTGVAAVLNMSGYECHCARDSEAAMKAVRGLTLDLIICDMNVDGNKGAELCAEIREAPDSEDVPVIFVSAEAQAPNIVQQAHEAGGFYYLRKPFDPDVLMALVDKALWMPHLVNNQLGTVQHETSKGGVVEHNAQKSTAAPNFMGSIPAVPSAFNK